MRRGEEGWGAEGWSEEGWDEGVGNYLKPCLGVGHPNGEICIKEGTRSLEIAHAFLHCDLTFHGKLES